MSKAWVEIIGIVVAGIVAVMAIRYFKLNLTVSEN